MTFAPLWYGWGGLNAWLFMLAQEVRSAAFEPALSLVSAAGSFASAMYVARAVGAAALRVVRDGERGIIVGSRLDEPWAEMLFRFLLASAAAAAAVWLLKTWLHFPRPWELLGWQPGLSTLPADADASFPSGHAAFAAVVVGSLWPRLRGRAARAVLVLYTVSVGLSRVLLGAHFPADVVAGYAVGLGSAWGAGRVLRGSGRREAAGSDERPKRTEGEIAG